MRKTTFLISATLSLLVAGAASAQVKPEDAIEYRQGVYKVIGWNWKPIVAMSKGEKSYDKDAFARNAANLEFMSKLAIEGFTPGSDMGAKTAAKAEIWTRMDDFKTKMNKMNVEATKLAAVAKTGNFEDIKKQVAATGASCKACHDDYRAK